MNQMTPPPRIEIIPASAPFSEAQRSWLNGFFAGLLSRWSDAAVGRSRAPRCCKARRAMATTAKRPGTTRPCRSPIA